eukprot:1195381-Prorocentrum_minimum.AAC.7
MTWRVSVRSRIVRGPRGRPSDRPADRLFGLASFQCPPTNGRARGGGAHNAHIIARNSACNTPMSSPILIDLTITPPASPPA